MLPCLCQYNSFRSFDAFKLLTIALRSNPVLGDSGKPEKFTNKNTVSMLVWGAVLKLHWEGTFPTPHAAKKKDIPYIFLNSNVFSSV